MLGLRLRYTRISHSSLSFFGVAGCAAGFGRRAGGGGIYTSADGGVTWSPSDAPMNLGWLSIASSCDGTRLAAVKDGVVDGGGIWTSVGRASNLQVSTLYNYRLVGISDASTGLGSNLT